MASKKVDVVNVVRHGQEFVIPDGVTLSEAITLLDRQIRYEEEVTKIKEPIEGFIWDGAIALNKAMRKMFGWATAEPTKTFFGTNPPQLISVEVGLNETTLVPWGEFSLPGIEGRIETGVALVKDRPCFEARATIKRKHEKQIRELFAEAKRILSAESIYRGKAFKLRLKDNNGEDLQVPMPSFIDLSKVKPEELIFSDEVNTAIETNLFTPIEHAEECRKNKVPLKRGVLFYGPYGTGKTLTSYVTAKKCTEHGWTFLYCERADELAGMIKLAHFYQPAVIFCEDIDRVVSGSRSIAIDDILNIIDGIESKNTELMVILTTNHVENINKALLRPGRLDAVIHVKQPDAPAVEKLLRIYGRGLIAENADLTDVAALLEGTIPAVIRECAERAKLSQIKLGTQGGARKMMLTPDALLEAARGMKNQLDLLEDRKPTPSTFEVLGTALSDVVKESATPSDILRKMKVQIDDIHDQTC